LDTNLMIVLDVSGSMTTADGVNGTTRLASAVASIKTLLDTYDQLGDVMVRLVTFSTSAAEVGSTWMTVSNARTALDAMTAVGGTNYDAALNAAMSAFGTASGKLTGTGVQSLSYFFSDGVPTYGYGSTSTLSGSLV